MKTPPRLSLAHLPTPLQPLTRLSEALGVALWVKRDDLTGSALSGNKIRKLEPLLADAVAQGATHVVTCGGVQSNHCRATALAAAPLGLKPVLLLRTARGVAGDLPTPPGGNVLLDRLAGAELRPCTPDDYRERRGALMQEIADRIAADGGRAYIVPEGGSNALGAMGYVTAVDEIVAQLGAPPDSIITATGSGGTLAGLALGLRAHGHGRAYGVAVCDDAAYFRAIVDRLAAQAAADWAAPALTHADYDVIEGFQGRGYALSTPDELAFLAETARRDGLVLDPVYSGKAFRAVVTLLRDDPRRFGERVVFVHTGGIFGLFPKATELDEVL